MAKNMTNNAGNIGDAVRQALSDVQSMADSKTIIGDPIVVGGLTLIPVSKVSIGVGIGGGTYGKTTPNGAGGGGTGLTVTPVAFLVVTESGETRLLNVGSDAGSGAKIAGTVSDIDKALDDVPEIITKVKGIFKKDKGDAESTEAPAQETAE